MRNVLNGTKCDHDLGQWPGHSANKSPYIWTSWWQGVNFYVHHHTQLGEKHRSRVKVIEQMFEILGPCKLFVLWHYFTHLHIYNHIINHRERSYLFATERLNFLTMTVHCHPSFITNPRKTSCFRSLCI